MNSSTLNKYEAYELHAGWNMTPTGPVQCTKFVTTRFVATAVKCLYGEAEDESRPETLVLARGWGRNNAELLESWFQLEKIDNLLRVELGLNEVEE